MAVAIPIIVILLIAVVTVIVLAAVTASRMVVAVVVVAILLIMLPGYRLFFLVSVLIGLVIWRGLALWYQLHPIKDEDVSNKRPLGL